MAEIVTQGDPGAHNRSLDASMSRIIEGGTWKRQRVIALVPSDKMISFRTAMSVWNLYSPPNQAFVKWGVMGHEVGEAYSQAITQILAHPELSTWEYLLTIEADNEPPPDGLVKLIRRMEAHPEMSCIGGLYWTKGESGVPQIWGDPTDPVQNFRPQIPKPGQLVECVGTGMGFNLWRLSMFKDEKLRKPWFKTINGLNEPGIGTQDLYFWGDARKYGYRCGVDCDVLVGHRDVNTGVCW